MSTARKANCPSTEQVLQALSDSGHCNLTPADLDKTLDALGFDDPARQEFLLASARDRLGIHSARINDLKPPVTLGDLAGLFA